MFRFASPIYFLLLFVIPISVYWSAIKKQRPEINMSGLNSVKNIKSSLFLKFRWLVPAIKYTAFILLVIALARPQWGTKHVNITSEGINIVLAVDLSESMAALDFKKGGKIINRLEAVKGVVRDFISKREGDRIGMVVFGTRAFTQLPLTRDYSTISFLMDKIEIGAAGKSTAIGDAIGISVKRLEDIESQSNIIILLTDGKSNAGEMSPQMASQIASDKNIKIYTIGVGTKGKAPFLVKNPLWGDRYIYQKVDIDEDTLRFVADKTGGIYFRAEDVVSLEKIYNTIDEMEKTEVKVKTFEQFEEFYNLLLYPSLFLIVCYIALINTRFLRIP